MVTTTLQGGAGQSIRVLSLIFEVEASKLVRHAADKCKQVLLVIDHLVRLDVRPQFHPRGIAGFLHGAKVPLHRIGVDQDGG